MKRPDGPPVTGDVAWPPLIAGTLIKRYKRFLADVRLADGRVVTAHCPNSGSMKGSCEPGRPVYISSQNSPKRKLKFTWELIRMPGTLVGVNALVPNRLVYQALMTKQVPALKAYDAVHREVSIGNHSRIDLMLTRKTGERCYVEVKNSTWVTDGVARFPDAVTTRGRKHLETLAALVAKGHQAFMFFLIQRMDAGAFGPADDIDPEYGKALRQAVNSGVKMLVYDVSIDLKKITLNQPVAYKL